MRQDELPLLKEKIQESLPKGLRCRVPVIYPDPKDSHFGKLIRVHIEAGKKRLPICVNYPVRVEALPFASVDAIAREVLKTINLGAYAKH